MYQVHPSSSLRRAAACAGVLALTLAAGAACTTGSSPAASSSGSTAPSTATSASGSTSAPATPASATSTTAAAATGTGGSGSGSGSGAAGTGSGSGSGGSGPSTCQPSQLSASVGASQGTAGSVYVNIVFKNTGSSPCTMTGYPGVSLGAGSPAKQVGQPAARNPQVTPRIVTLIPNAHAFAVLQIGDAGNYPSGTCDPSPTTSLLVYPPNTTSRLSMPYNSTGCRGDIVTMHVEAVQPGTGS